MTTAVETMQVVPFAPGHLSDINLRCHDTPAFELYSRGMTERFNAGEIKHGWSGMVGTDVVACGGVFTLWPGVGEAWIVGSDMVTEYALSFHRAVKTHLWALCKSGEYHRIQCIVRDSFKGSHPWVKRLGFQWEGKLRAYSPEGHDCHMYSILIGGKHG
jgi:hypothetical protein